MKCPLIEKDDRSQYFSGQKRRDFFKRNQTVINQSNVLVKLILQWVIEHPQFISNQFYVGGDSYSGLIVPVLTQIIADGKMIQLLYDATTKQGLEDIH